MTSAPDSAITTTTAAAPTALHVFDDGARATLSRPFATLPPIPVTDAELREKLQTGCYVLYDNTTGAIVRCNPFDPTAPSLPTVREALSNARAAWLLKTKASS